MNQEAWDYAVALPNLRIGYALRFLEMFVLLFLPRIVLLARLKERSWRQILICAFCFALIGSNLLVTFFYWPASVLQQLVRHIPDELVMRICRQFLIVSVLMITDVGVMLVAKWYSKKVMLWLLVLNIVFAVTSLPEQVIFNP